MDSSRHFDGSFEEETERRNSYDLQGLFWILAGGFDDTQKPMAIGDMVDDDDDA